MTDQAHRAGYYGNLAAAPSTFPILANATVDEPAQPVAGSTSRASHIQATATRMGLSVDELCRQIGIRLTQEEVDSATTHSVDDSTPAELPTIPDGALFDTADEALFDDSDLVNFDPKDPHIFRELGAIHRDTAGVDFNAQAPDPLDVINRASESLDVSPNFTTYSQPNASGEALISQRQDQAVAETRAFLGINPDLSGIVYAQRYGARPPGAPRSHNTTDVVRRPSSRASGSTWELTNTSSSLIITTPVTGSDRSHFNVSDLIGPSAQDPAVTPEEAEFYARNVDVFGPCSRSWVVPRKSRKSQQPRSTARKRKRDNDSLGEGPRPRGSFKDEELRQETAQTRINQCCIRCRMQRIRCRPDPDSPKGTCLNCIEVKRPILGRPLCVRRIITDSSLYREQDRPYQLFSKRWQNMDIEDITTWASDEIETVVISQIFLDAPYPVEVRKFKPVDGDMIEEKWKSGAVFKSHWIPPYAIADMKKTAAMLEEFIDQNVATYIFGAVGTSDELLWQTYHFAFKHLPQAKTVPEQRLLADCFRLWVGCRKTSNPHHIYGDETLGACTVDDPDSIFYNRVPIPAIMMAQMECIMYTRVLRPTTARVLHRLNWLVNENKRQYWLTIYLTMFILFHSCAMMTQRDWETARQYDLQENFANYESIRKSASGVNCMLAHFHYLNKGVLPFQLTYDAKALSELRRAADLNEEQVNFVRLTSKLVNNPQRASVMKEVREKKNFGHDLYWVSQLFEKDWKLGPTP